MSIEQPRCWSTLPSHLLSLILDALPDAHDVASAQATCRAWDLQQRQTSMSITIKGGHRFGDGDLDAFAAQWRRKSATIKQATAVMQSQQVQHPITSLQLTVQLSCNKLGVPMPSNAGTDPEARSTARQLLAALPASVVRLQLSEVFTSLPELGEVLGTLCCLRHLTLEVSPASLTLLAGADNLQNLTQLQSLELTSPHPLCFTSGMCPKDRFTTGRPLNDLTCLPSLPLTLQSLSLGNLPLGAALTAALFTSRRCSTLTDMALHGCHADLRSTPFPWHGLQRVAARQATLGATHAQLVAFAACPTLHAVDLRDARLYDLVACGVEYLGFSFKRWTWTSPLLHHADLRLRCDSSKAPWATYCNGPLGELFGRCYSPLTPHTTLVMPPTVHTCAIQSCAVEFDTTYQQEKLHDDKQCADNRTQNVTHETTHLHFRGTLQHLISTNTIAHPALTTVSLRLGASQVLPLLTSLPHLQHAHLTADHRDTHLDLDIPPTAVGCTLHSLTLEGFVLGRVDLRGCAQLQSLSLAVPHTQHIQRSYSAQSAGGSSSSSDGGYSSASDDEGPVLRPLHADQPCVLLPMQLRGLSLRGGVPMLLSEVLPGPQGCGMAYAPAGADDRVLWDLRGLRGLRRLAVHDGERRLDTCVKLPYGVESLVLGDAWGPSALDAWGARLQNLRELRLCPVDSPRGLRETLSGLPMLRTLHWGAEQEQS